MPNLKIVMCGCHEAGWEKIKHLLKHGIYFAYFVSLTPTQAQQYKMSGYKDFTDLAEQYQIPIYYPKEYSLKSEEDISFFQKQRFDLLVQGGWQRLFPKEVLESLAIGGIGGHGSAEFLPKGRGHSPINWSLIEGKKKFIMQLFWMTPEADSGNIIDYEAFDINDWDTCRTLYYKNSIVSKRMLLRTICRIQDGSVTGHPQEGEPSYYPKRTPDDGMIDWQCSARHIYNLVRACTRPYPGAFSFLDGNKITIWRAQPFDSQILYPDASLGEVVEHFHTGDFVVKCGDSVLLVTDYEGKTHVGGLLGGR